MSGPNSALQWPESCVRNDADVRSGVFIGGLVHFIVALMSETTSARLHYTFGFRRKIAHDYSKKTFNTARIRESSI